MKKTLALLLALTMVLALAACGGTPAAPQAPAEQPAEAPAEQPVEAPTEQPVEAPAEEAAPAEEPPR